MSETASPEEVGKALKNKYWKAKEKGEGVSGVFVRYLKSDFDRVVERDGKKTIETKTVYQVELTNDAGETVILPNQCTPSCYAQNAAKGDAVVAIFEGEGVAKRAGQSAPKLFKVTVSK